MSIGRTRVRATPPAKIVTGVETASFDSSFRKEYSRASNFNTLREKEITRDHTNPGPPYRTGGSFYNLKSVNPWFDLKGNVDITSSSGLRYRGGFLPGTMGTAGLSATELQLQMTSGDYQDELYGSPYEFGAGAWNKFRPKTSSPADMSLFLWEMRDTLPMLKTTAGLFHNIWKALGGRGGEIFRPGHAADQFLNNQFGWRPFVKDLSDFSNSIDNFSDRLKQLKRDNGRWIKRGGSVRQTNSITSIQDWTTHQMFPNLVSQYYRGGIGANGRSTVIRREIDDVWFEGRFRYYVPEFDDSKPDAYKSMKQKLRLYGFQLTPSTIWNGMPWSWLNDYVYNTGDVIDNYSASINDNLVAKYAYIMRRRASVNILHTVAFFRNRDLTLEWIQKVDTKQRQKANPFGFGPTGVELNSRQLAILLALGLSRYV